MTRNQRRKAAKARREEKIERLACEARNQMVQETVRKNLKAPRPERSPKGLGNRSVYGGFGSYSGVGHVCGLARPNKTGVMNDRELKRFRNRIAS